jgi:hypothetical protein
MYVAICNLNLIILDATSQDQCYKEFFHRDKMCETECSLQIVKLPNLISARIQESL